MGWGAHGNPVFRNLHDVSSLKPALWRDSGHVIVLASLAAALISAALQAEQN